MEERYIRNLGALTESDCLTLRGKRAFVAGCGGLGGYIVELLLRLGIGGVTAADGDVFEASNLNRQLYALPALLGRNKAVAAAERARLVNPGVSFRAVPDFITEENAPALLAGCDVALDALDSAGARKLLSSACAAAGIPLIHGAIRGWTAQAAISLPGDALMELLYPAGDAPGVCPSLSFTPPFCAAMQVALCAKLLCGRPVQPGRVYLADLLDMDFAALF